MLIVEKNLNIRKSENFREIQCKIKQTATSFAILSSGIYKDKIRAVIRELCTNAYDAHVAANKASVPFEVYLPNSMDLTFAIKDYGTGMTVDEIENLYSTYFESSRTGSNDFVGQLGIGSKSPFSYTDTFIVISRTNGKKYTYVVFVNSEGIPCLSQMGNEDTDEPNGLEVKMNVVQNDIYDFCDKAKLILRRFDPLPIVKGDTINLESPAYVIQTKTWALRGKPGQYRYGYLAQPLAIMGNVEYDLNSNDIDSQYKNLLDLDIDLFFKIGDIDFVAGREQLSLNKRTIQAIDKALNCIAQESFKEYQIHIDNCKSLRQAKEFIFNNNDHDGGEWKVLFDKIKKSDVVKWQGHDIDNNYIVVPDEFDIITYKSTYYRRIVDTDDKSRDIDIATTIVIDDTDLKNIDKKCKTLVRETKNNVVYFKPKDDKHKREFMKSIGVVDSDITLASSLVSMVCTPRSKPVYTYILQIDSGYRADYLYHYWRKEKINIDTTSGVYIPYENHWCLVDQVRAHPSTISAIMSSLSILDIKFNLYGFTKIAQRQAKSNPKWMIFNDFVKSKVDEYVSKNKIDLQKMADFELLDHFKYKNILCSKDLISNAKEIKEYRSTIEDLTKYGLSNEKLSVIKTLLKNCNHMLPDPSNILEQEEKIVNKYPMLKIIRSLIYGSQLKNYWPIINDYIHSISKES